MTSLQGAIEWSNERFRYFLITYYINITFPDWVIVENIITRNVIIIEGAAEVDNQILRDDIFRLSPNQGM